MTMTNEDLLNSRELRNKCAGRYDVLEKIKQLLLIPGTEFATTQQVAGYYGVGVEIVQKLYQRNKAELDEDGVSLKKRNYFLIGHNVQLENRVGKSIAFFNNGEILEIPNRGLKVFPRRAILRVGMLLRDSEIAKEVRTQLLNIEEKTSEDIKLQDISEEQKLAMSLGMAQASGDTTATAIAFANMIAFKNRHITKLQQDNKGLAGEILDWEDRSKLNAGVRKLAAVTGQQFHVVWNELYKQLKYKYGMDLKVRADGKKPHIQHVKENEWPNVIKSFCAMCEAYKQSPTEMFQQQLMVNQ